MVCRKVFKAHWICEESMQVLAWNENWSYNYFKKSQYHPLGWGEGHFSSPYVDSLLHTHRRDIKFVVEGILRRGEFADILTTIGHVSFQWRNTRILSVQNISHSHQLRTLRANAEIQTGKHQRDDLRWSVGTENWHFDNSCWNSWRSHTSREKIPRKGSTCTMHHASP